MFERKNKNEVPNDTDYVIMGVPFEATSTSSRPGSKNAPSAIRSAFEYFSLLTEQGTDIFQKKIIDIGDIEVYPSLLDETLNSINETIFSISSLRQENPPIPVIMGGDHFITYPIIQTLSQSTKVGIIIFDAHVDLYDKWLYKEQYAHCTVFHRILELNSIGPKNLLFVGTRDVDYEEAEYLKAQSIKPLYAYEIPPQNIETVFLKKLENFRDQKINNVYVSIDIDALDPSCAPGTGYPIPGGLTYRQIWQCLQIIAQNFTVLGFDVVEVCPPYDVSEMTSIIAARIIMEFLGFIINNEK